MSGIPELLKNQLGVTCKVYDGGQKFDDRMLYVTINQNSLSLELYPDKPVIIIDKDVAKMLLGKIAGEDAMVPSGTDADQLAFDTGRQQALDKMNELEAGQDTAMENSGDAEELKDLEGNGGLSAKTQTTDELSALPDKDGIF